MQFIENETKGRLLLGAGTLYGALNTLQEKGWIVPCRTSDGRKKEYQITEDGKAVTKTELERLHSLEKYGRKDNWWESMSKKCYRYFGGLLQKQEDWLNKMAEQGLIDLSAWIKMLYEFENCNPSRGVPS